MINPTKVLLIGIDAADKDLLTQWSQEGQLPTFHSLFERGAWGTTLNPPGVYVGAMWPSFYTSLSPTRHGRYAFKQIKAGSYDLPKFFPRDTKGEPFWMALSRAGRKVALIDIPKSSLTPNLNGIQIVDWTTHDPDEGFQTWPPDLKTKIEGKFGTDPVGICDHFGQKPDDYIALRDALLSRVRMKTELSSHFLNQGGWDLFMTVFAESHCVGHQCWHLHDPKDERYNPETSKAVGNPIKEVYQALDRDIARLIHEAGPETTIFILASHGMGDFNGAAHLLEDMLRRLEKPRAQDFIRTALRNCWHLLPPLLRSRLFKGFKKKISDRSSRICFEVPNNILGGIRINVIGREPNGKINPGAEYDTFCATLTQDLLAFTNSENGKPVVKHVRRTQDLYPGEDTSAMPDLIVEWTCEGPPPSVIYSPKTGTIKSVYAGCRTGDHTPEGMFFVLGPQIKPGPINHAVSIMDFGPTLAAFTGVTLTGIDGKSFAPEICIRENMEK